MICICNLTEQPFFIELDTQKLDNIDQKDFNFSKRKYSGVEGGF